MVPLSRHTLHAVIDMQRIFAEPGGWCVPEIGAILPNVTRLCARTGPETVYARFRTPARADLAPGRWNAFYQRWPEVLSDALDPAVFDLVEPLRSLSQRGVVVDKMGYSLLSAPTFPSILRERRIDTLVLSGVETDVCVLATLFSAVDLGLRVVLASDAVTSADPEAHRGTLDMLARRLPEQVEMATTDDILHSWPR